MRKLAYIMIVAAVAIFAAQTQSCDSQEQSSSDAELKAMRLQIDSLDDQLVDILSERMKVCQAVGEYKKKNNISVVQSNRYNELVERLCKKGKEQGLTEDFVKKIMDTIHEESVRQQNEIMDK